MKSRQVGYVLMALIAIGIAGLIARAVTSGPEELVLSGILPLAEDVIDRVTIESEDGEAELINIGDAWFIQDHRVFLPRLSQFWSTVEDFDGARLIATKTANHERMGVADGQGTTVSFYVGAGIQERFIIGKWTPDVRLCYLRRAGNDEVYGIPCPFADTFVADTDSWRDPVVVRIPSSEVESVTFTYPDEELVLRQRDDQWVVARGDEEHRADFVAVASILQALELVIARGFAGDEEARGLRFETPDAMLRIVTKEGSTVPTTRLRLLERGDGSYYLKTPVQPAVFILDPISATTLLKRAEDLMRDGGG